MAALRLPAHIGLNTVLVLLPIDLFFRTVIDLPAAGMWTYGHTDAHYAAFARIFFGTLPLELIWIIGFLWVLSPIERWRRMHAAGGAPAGLAQIAARTAHRAPQRLAVIYVVHWT